MGRYDDFLDALPDFDLLDEGEGSDMDLDDFDELADLDDEDDEDGDDW